MVGLVALFVAAIVAYFALGMPGMDHGTGSTMGAMTSMDPRNSIPPEIADANDSAQIEESSRTPVKVSTVADLVAPSVFEQRRLNGGVLLNVHVPYEGEIPGTNISVPYNEIALSRADLPQNLGTPLLVYCRSGRMSAIAGKELLRMGYRNVTDLQGGMLAWEATGKPLLGSFGGVVLP